MIPAKSERMDKVKQFQSACFKAGLTEIAPYVYELQGSFTKTLTLSTLIHGNEIGGIEIFILLLKKLAEQNLSLKSNLRFILGNVPAYYEDKRFLESDLNRSFGLNDQKTSEELRAHELERYLEDSDVLIDIHQTIGSTSTPFFIFEFDQPSYNLARHLHNTLPVVTNTKKRAFKGMTSTSFAIGKGCLAMAIETGQKGIAENQISLGLELARKAMETDFEKTLPESGLSRTYTFYQIINNPDRTLEMVKQFQNFDQVRKGELLARNSEKEIFSEVDGVILFPKYGDYAKASVELALILKPVHVLEDLP